MNALARSIALRGSVLACAVGLALPFMATACDPPGTCYQSHDGYVSSNYYDNFLQRTGARAYVEAGWWSAGFGSHCSGVRVFQPWARDAYCTADLVVWGTFIYGCFPTQLDNVGDAGLIIQQDGQFITYPPPDYHTSLYGLHGQITAYYDTAVMFSSCWWDGDFPATGDVHCEHQHFF